MTEQSPTGEICERYPYVEAKGFCYHAVRVSWVQWLSLSNIDLEREKQMDWRVFVTTFGVIFLAEMGDKTQLAAMTMAAESKRPWAVFFGAALALTAVSGLGVLVGGVIGNYVPIFWVKRVAAVAFIIIGLLILLDKF